MAGETRVVNGDAKTPPELKVLPFKPILKSHILHCSYAFWHKLYRSITPKARIIPLSTAFVEYLCEDGIVLPDDEDDPQQSWTDQDSGVFSEDHSAASDEDDGALLDPSEHFREIHKHIKDTITELGGSIAPKLNWSAPKDATWIAATNSMQCQTANDIYLLLKSSDFVTHDLEHAFDGCEGVTAKETNRHEGVEENGTPSAEDVSYTLVLRKWIEMNPSVEFRCFVRERMLLAICQRDLNHFEFLASMVDQLRSLIRNFFDNHLKATFPDDDFVFDVYIPPPHKRVWLIDINPWAPRTDPLLFSWLELLQMVIPNLPENNGEVLHDIGTIPFVPELRLVRRDDPEAYGFTTPQYSAHKLPKDVVDASRSGPGPLREFADQWKEVLARQQQQEEEEEADGSEN